MFTIDPEGYIASHHSSVTTVDQTGGKRPFWTASMLSDIIHEKPGEFAVSLWNQLPGVVPITTPKFRNKSTAVERIWKKLAELYPDAIVAEEMPKAKESNGSRETRPKHNRTTEASKGLRTTSKATPNDSPKKRGSKSSWAEELTGELRKRYKPGQDFTLPDVYKLIPAFERRHKENQHIAARLRTTLAQDLRGNGIVKTLGKGKYRLV